MYNFLARNAFVDAYMSTKSGAEGQKKFSHQNTIYSSSFFLCLLFISKKFPFHILYIKTCLLTYNFSVLLTSKREIVPNRTVH